MNMMFAKPPGAPPEAFMARPVDADPELLDAYFRQVASYEADKRRGDRRLARLGAAFGAAGMLVGVLGLGAVVALLPLKTYVPYVFRVDDATGAVERVYDVRGGAMEATEAQNRFFLWQYVRLRQSFTAAEAQAGFDAVALMSSPPVQAEYAAWFRGSNPESPQVRLGRDGSAAVRWVSTSLLGPGLAQVRFAQVERKGGVELPTRRMVATIAFDFAPGEVSGAAINTNPLGFIVTSYRADTEATS